MPLLGYLLIGIFGNLAQFLVSFVGKKLAIGLSAVAALTTLMVGMYAALSLVLNSIVAQVPNLPGAAIGIWVAVPDNLPACFSAILATDTTIALFRWSVKNLQMMLFPA